MSRGQAVSAGVLLALGTLPAGAQESRDYMGELVVVAPYDAGLPGVKVPASVQRATAEDIERLQPLDLTDLLNRGFASVSINHAQNNPLQPDVNFRGYTASPLLGLPPGLTVYQNGVRINEPFGDTVNWDLLPLSAVHEIQLLAGSNPVFGLNTLGGSLSVRMKNGFNFQGTEGEVYAGSFTRRAGSIESGGNNGRLGYYANVDYLEEDGWRDFSKSDALRFFGTFSARGEHSTADLSVSYADTSLRGNGSSPAELLAIDREQVFTHPDITENKLTQIIFEGTRRFSDTLRLAGNVYYRDIDTDTFNGDGTIFEECDIDGEEFLVEEEFTDVDGDDECSSDVDEDIEVVLDGNGEPIEAEIGGEELNAVNNLGRRTQEIYGASLQLGVTGPLFGLDNELMLGAAWSSGKANFDSVVEVAQLLEDRSTSRTGIFAGEFATGVESDVDTASLYVANTLSLSDAATLTLSGRYDSTRVTLADQTGEEPDLNGRHRFSRFNPAIGATFRLTPAMMLYGSVSQSGRAPTPVELACASEDAPCNLPNAFLADPPLDEVVVTSAEAGLRGTSAGGVRWQVAAFHMVNEDDILFQTTGGAQANVGFFDNVSDTRRAGVELSLSRRVGRLGWSLQYSFVDATFEDDFIVNSPNHPVFEDDPGASEIVDEGKLLVRRGSEIPGIARHQGNLGLDFAFTDRFRIGADAEYRSGVYLRGDEPNLLGRTDSYVVVNARAEYRLGDAAALFLRVENAFDEEYETFGLLGEPDEVFEEFEDPRFFGAGPPFGVWLGLRVHL